MKKIAFICFLLWSSLGLACDVQLKDLGLCADVKWIIGPKYGIFSKADVKFYKAGDKSKLFDPSEKLNVYPWMVMDKGASHGSRPVSFKKLSQGHYELNLVQFLKMDGGTWELRFSPFKDRTLQKVYGVLPVEIKK